MSGSVASGTYCTRKMECDSRAQFTIPEFLTTDNTTENKNFSWEMKSFTTTGCLFLQLTT